MLIQYDSLYDAFLSENICINELKRDSHWYPRIAANGAWGLMVMIRQFNSDPFRTDTGLMWLMILGVFITLAGFAIGFASEE